MDSLETRKKTLKSIFWWIYVAKMSLKFYRASRMKQPKIIENSTISPWINNIEMHVTTVQHMRPIKITYSYISRKSLMALKINFVVFKNGNSWIDQILLNSFIFEWDRIKSMNCLNIFALDSWVSITALSEYRSRIHPLINNLPKKCFPSARDVKDATNHSFNAIVIICMIMTQKYPNGFRQSNGNLRRESE